MVEGDVSVSLGTSGVVAAISPVQSADSSGMVAGFSDATGRFLPLACTLNASRIMDAACSILGVGYEELDSYALSVGDGADGLVMVPYLEGERTPNKPEAKGAIHGLTLANATPAHLARAAIEGMLCLLADGMDAISSLGIGLERVLLIGGGARSRAVRELAPRVLGRPVTVPPAAEYVALGAARQAAAVATGSWPTWVLDGSLTYEGRQARVIRDQYLEVRDLTLGA
jgi:xylulokinase